MEIEVLEKLERGKSVSIDVDGDKLEGTINDVDAKHDRVSVALE